MRIVHCIRSLVAKIGGPPMVVTRLAACQQEAGHDVTIIFEDLGHPLLPIPAQLEQADMVMIPKPNLSDRVIDVPFSKLAEKKIGQADIVHIHGVWRRVPYRGMKTAIALDKPFLISPHGMLNEWALQQNPLRKQAAFWWGTRKLIQQANGMHALSEYEFNCVRDWGHKGEVALIPNGVDLSEMDPLPCRGTFRKQHPMLQKDGKDLPFILFLARLHPGKGLNRLADAFAKIASKFPDLRLVVVGPDSGAQSEFEARVAQHGLQEKVLLPGPLWGSDKYAALTDAYCYCLHSDHESFSVAIVEALACGCPVVISDECHFPGVATADAGIVCPLNSDDLANALARLAADPDLAAEMGLNARAYVEEQFQWPHITDSLVEFYKTLAKNDTNTSVHRFGVGDVPSPQPLSELHS